MFAVQLLVKMPHVQIEIPIAVESEHLLHPRHRHPFRRGFALPPFEQTVVAKLLIALAPAPHLSIANADDLGGLPPRYPFRHGAQKITSWTFIARSTAAFVYENMLRI